MILNSNSEMKLEFRFSYSSTSIVKKLCEQLTCPGTCY